MKKILLAGIAAAAFCGAPAIAADMPTKGPVYKAAPAPMFNWTGFYAGINGGGAFKGGDDPINYNAPVTGFAGFSPGLDPSGGFGGGQIGYNWQAVGSTLVFGVEADIQGSHLRDAFNVTTPSNGGPLGVNAQQRIDYFGTVRGRFGFALDSKGVNLIYATGGFAYGGVKDSILLTNGPATALLAKSFTGTGFVVGGGWEYHFMPAWSLKAEYQYIDLGTQKLSGVSTNGVLLNASDVENRFQTARIGLNYKFGSY
jgi:outer membrane immunogenic protein